MTAAEFNELNRFGMVRNRAANMRWQAVTMQHTPLGSGAP